MKISFHSPITLEGKPDSEATVHASEAVKHAKLALQLATAKLNGTKRTTKVLYKVRQRMAEQAARVANSLREE